ncbi:MAG: hypothetical protein QXG15_01460 [Desulfurococcaceae archaeon]
MIRVAVVKLTSCSGCITEILTSIVSDEELAREVSTLYFPELGFHDALSEYDVVLVEGSVTTNEQRNFIKAVRERSSILVAVGTCATLGGVQALRTCMNSLDLITETYGEGFKHRIYGSPIPLDELVEVDYHLPGCPVNAEAVKNLLKKLLLGGFPVKIVESVCGDCKRKGNRCLLVELGEPCLGPITLSGCGALCPSRRRGCYGCYGLRIQDLSPENLKHFIERTGKPEHMTWLLKAYGYKHIKVLGV